MEAALSRRCLEILGLGKRAGALALGFDQVEAAIRQSPPFGLVEAADGAADGREKLVRLTFGLWSQAPPIVGCFSAADGSDRLFSHGVTTPQSGNLVPSPPAGCDRRRPFLDRR